MTAKRLSDLTPQEIHDARSGKPESTGRCWYCWSRLGRRAFVKRGREFCSDSCARREPPPGDEVVA